MTIIVDSREKWTQPNSTDIHIKQYFERHGIQYDVQAMKTADYMLDGNNHILIDRKQNLDEVAGNLFREKRRFYDEVRRAHAAKQKLIILVEHSGQVKSIRDVSKWKSKYGRVSGRQLMRAMEELDMKYGVKPPNDYGIIWEFCSKRSTGRRIIELLSGGGETNE